MTINTLNAHELASIAHGLYMAAKTAREQIVEYEECCTADAPCEEHTEDWTNIGMWGDLADRIHPYPLAKVPDRMQDKHVVVLFAEVRDPDGKPILRMDPTPVHAVIKDFNGFEDELDIDEQRDDRGHRILVACPTEHGEYGAYRLLGMARLANLSAHVQ